MTPVASLPLPSFSLAMASTPPGARAPSPDLEAYSLAHGREPLEIDARDVRVRRALAQPGEQRLGGVVGALGEHLDAAVEEVARPAREAQPPRLGRHRRAEADALHAPAYRRAQPLHGWTRTVGSAWSPARATGPSMGIERGAPGRPSARTANRRTAPSSPTWGTSIQRPSGVRSAAPKRPASTSIAVAASSAPTR